MDTNKKGNIGLAKVLTELISKGYNCFLPFTDTTCVDLIVGNSKMELKRIQVKYRQKNKNGSIDVPLETVVNGKKIPVERNKIDYYIVYCPDNEKIYYVDLNVIPKVRSFTLRIDSTNVKSENIRYASDFENFNMPS
jgi:PD-(D/E)XK endonuclease